MGCEKKHYLQMKNNEKIFINKKLKNIKNIIFSNHSEVRMKQKHISQYLVINTLKSYDIIEFNIHNNDARVLLRGRNNFRRNICVVVSLITYKIITVYDNDITDNHPTIDWDNYDENIDIIKEINQKAVKNNLKYKTKRNCVAI